jgi:hypothetical protein
VKERLGRATGLSPEKLRLILSMKQVGQSLQSIKLNSKSSKQFLTNPEEAHLEETVVGFAT